MNDEYGDGKIDLKPCPFCGQEPQMQRCDQLGYWAFCRCGIEDGQGHPDPRIAAARWNRRVSDKPLGNQERGDMVEKIRAQKTELTHLNETCRKKTLALDAMHYVWCTGCAGGVHQKCEDAPPITEELVREAERAVKRLRKWYRGQIFREAWESLSDRHREIHMTNWRDGSVSWEDICNSVIGHYTLKDRIESELKAYGSIRERVSEGLSRWRSQDGDNSFPP